MNQKILFVMALLFAGGFWASAQKSFRIGYVDMEYILENVPEYQQATAQLDQRLRQWHMEAEAKRKEIDRMKEHLEHERPLLTKELIEEREEEIRYQEEQVFAYEQRRFGPDGDYITQKKQLARPIQDQVFIAVQEIAENRNLDMIFDSSSENGMIYASGQLDVSDQVLRSINRSANRRQLDTREEVEALEREEDKTLEQEQAVSERQEANQESKQQREVLVEERKRKMDSLRDARKLELEQRRKRILEERQKKQDSLAALRKQKDTIN